MDIVAARERLSKSPSQQGQPDQHRLQMAGWQREQTSRDLMLVNCLCMDFRQKLLSVLYTSCQTSFVEARNLAKEKLLELLERMTSVEGLSTACSSLDQLQYMDSGALSVSPVEEHGAPLALLAPAPADRMQTDGLERMAVALDSGLPPGCSDFMDFDLLSDGEVFSIGIHVRDPVTSVDSRRQQQQQHHVTTPHPTQGPPATVDPLPAAPSSHRLPGSPDGEQRQTRVAARAACRGTPNSGAAAAAAGEAENLEVIESALLSTGWAHALPNYLPPADVVFATFTHHLGESKQSIALLLTRLFYAVGSPDALCQLQHAIKLGRENSAMPVYASNDLATTVQALDHLDSMTTLSHILRRFYLVRLLEHRTRLEQDHVSAKLAWRRSKRMLKYDCARLELVKAGGSSSSQNQIYEPRSKACPSYRSKSQALADLMQMLYPDLKPVVDAGPAGGGQRASQDCVYSRKLTKLRNRLSCARNWYKFEQTFPGGILALIPCAGRFSISIDQVEKLPSDALHVFLNFLQEHRGAFLQNLSQTLSTNLFDVLARTDLTPAFVFESAGDDAFGDALYDTDQLVRLCRHV